MLDAIQAGLGALAEGFRHRQSGREKSLAEAGLPMVRNWRVDLRLDARLLQMRLQGSAFGGPRDVKMADIFLPGRGTQSNPSVVDVGGIAIGDGSTTLVPTIE